MSDTPRTDAVVDAEIPYNFLPQSLIDIARQLERELTAAQGETISCSHVRQGDYMVKRLFMCHACIERVKACYIQNAAPPETGPMGEQHVAERTAPPADAAPDADATSNCAI